ncbi:MAG: 50S ribosomal protein L25/general stress protein Ctc [Hyphomicrobiaceae bacterium]|nr:50S ribosomal protein L25/general stress protein Ctc [Hyphomicrobiaceae bacterium]
MAYPEIKAKARPRAGKGAARQVRREGLVPGVIYGDKEAAVTVALDSRALSLIISKGKFLSTLFMLDVDGAKTRVIPRDVQLDPVKDFPLHVDFQRVTSTSRIRVSVPCKFVNEAASPGLKRGGVLNIVRHDVEVMCAPDHIPASFDFDLTGLEIGRSIHISSVTMPEGARLVINNRDFTVATIAGAKADEEKQAAADAAAAAAAAPTAAAAAPAAGAKAAAPAAGGKAAPAAAKPAAKPAAKK